MWFFENCHSTLNFANRAAPDNAKLAPQFFLYRCLKTTFSNRFKILQPILRSGGSSKLVDNAVLFFLVPSSNQYLGYVTEAQDWQALVATLGGPANWFTFLSPCFAEISPWNLIGNVEMRQNERWKHYPNIFVCNFELLMGKFLVTIVYYRYPQSVW